MLALISTYCQWNIKTHLEKAPVCILTHWQVHSHAHKQCAHRLACLMHYMCHGCFRNPIKHNPISLCWMWWTHYRMLAYTACMMHPHHTYCCFLFPSDLVVFGIQRFCGVDWAVLSTPEVFVLWCRQPNREDIVNIVHRMYEKDGISRDEVVSIVNKFPNQGTSILFMDSMVKKNALKIKVCMVWFIYFISFFIFFCSFGFLWSS